MARLSIIVLLTLGPRTNVCFYCGNTFKFNRDTLCDPVGVHNIVPVLLYVRPAPFISLFWPKPLNNYRKTYTGVPLYKLLRWPDKDLHVCLLAIAIATKVFIGKLPANDERGSWANKTVTRQLIGVHSAMHLVHPNQGLVTIT